MLVALAGRESPVAVPVASRRAGQEIAARVAVRLDAGIVSDVIDIRFTVRTEAVEPREAPVEPIVRDVDVPVPDRRGAARLVSRVPMDAAHRPAREAQIDLLAEIRRRRSTSTPRSATRRNR